MKESIHLVSIGQLMAPYQARMDCRSSLKIQIEHTWLLDDGGPGSLQLIEGASHNDNGSIKYGAIECFGSFRKRKSEELTARETGDIEVGDSAYLIVGFASHKYQAEPEKHKAVPGGKQGPPVGTVVPDSKYVISYIPDKLPHIVVTKLIEQPKIKY